MAVTLVDFAQQPDVTLTGEEWSSDVANISGINLYAVITVSPTGDVNYSLATNTRTYRCVIPIVV